MTERKQATVRSVKKRAHQKGVTLIELLVVVVILGVLAGIVALNVLPAQDTARRRAAETQISIFRTALQQYSLDMGRFPTTEDGLEALVNEPSDPRRANSYRPGGYLDKSQIPLDPWGNPYVYLFPGEQAPFEIISYGKDGRPSGTGADADINSWE